MGSANHRFCPFLHRYRPLHCVISTRLHQYQYHQCIITGTRWIAAKIANSPNVMWNRVLGNINIHCQYTNTPPLRLSHRYHCLLCQIMDPVLSASIEVGTACPSTSYCCRNVIQRHHQHVQCVPHVAAVVHCHWYYPMTMPLKWTAYHRGTSIVSIQQSTVIWWRHTTIHTTIVSKIVVR